jgi:transcriptional regulator with XRE-family HTH domain
MRVRDPQALKRWRERRGLSQRDLAFLCKCSQNAISLLEKGAMQTCSEDLALTLARRLDVPWEDLFETRESPGMRRMTTARQSVDRRAVKVA